MPLDTTNFASHEDCVTKALQQFGKVMISALMCSAQIHILSLAWVEFMENLYIFFFMCLDHQPGCKPYNSQLKFVIRLTVNHLILIMLVQRI